MLRQKQSFIVVRSWLSFVFGMIIFSIIWILLGQANGVKVTPDLEQQFTVR